MHLSQKAQKRALEAVSWTTKTALLLVCRRTARVNKGKSAAKEKTTANSAATSHVRERYPGSHSIRATSSNAKTTQRTIQTPEKMGSRSGSAKSTHKGGA